MNRVKCKIWLLGIPFTCGLELPSVNYSKCERSYSFSHLLRHTLSETRIHLIFIITFLAQQKSSLSNALTHFHLFHTLGSTCITMNLQCTCVKIVIRTLQSAINPHPSTKDSTSFLLFASMDQRGQRPGSRVRDHGRGQKHRGVHSWWSCITVKGENRAQVSNATQESIIDHVINHTLSFREAGQRVQPILSQGTVASIARHYQNDNR